MQSQSKAVETCINQLKRLRSEHKVKLGQGTSTSNQHAKYGCVYEDGTELLINSNSKTGWPCHGLLSTRSASDIPTEAVYSLWIEPDESYNIKEATEAYFSWITGSNSPWRALVFNPSFAFQDQKFIREYGFIFQNLNTLPANQMMNFLVATRMPKEWPTVIRAWYDLVQEGITPGMAMVALSVFHLEVTTESYSLISSPRYDWPLDVPNRTELYVQNFLRGEMAHFTPGFNTKSSYGPINELWGKWTPQTSALYIAKLYDMYHNLGKIDKQASKFGTTQPQYYHWRLTRAEVIEIIKQEQERLLG